MSFAISRSEIALGCALPIDYLVIRDVRLRVHCGFGLRVRLDRLVESGVAEVRSPGWVDGTIWIRRGPTWVPFYGIHGYADTRDGVAQLDLEDWFSRDQDDWGCPSPRQFTLSPGQRITLRPQIPPMGNVVPFPRPSAF